MSQTQQESPRFAAALSTSNDTRAAAREAARAARDKLGAAAQLAMIFASIDHAEEFPALAEIVHRELGTDCLLGSTGESIVCNDREIEDESALAVWVGRLPGVTLLPMHVEFDSEADGGAFVGWHDELGEPWPADSSLLLMAEPFTFPTDLLLERLEHDRPGVPIIGGMASGGGGPGENRLLLGDRTFNSGAVAVRVSGPVKIRSVVSQGCRPIGRPFVITKADRNVILELGGKPPLAQLQELFGTLSPEEQQLARQGLHVGQVINEYQEGFSRGDFLVRNVQGADSTSGAIAVGDMVRAGRTIQFHVRDAASADEDLRHLLAASRQASPDCRGALLFTCNGRGTRLFDQPHHDARALAECWPQLSVAGFFAQGEIGPVGGKNFLHGFTASIALFEGPG